jgi:hypothetical protein
MASTTFDLIAAVCTAVVSLGLGGVFVRQYRERRRTHALWWSVAFAVIGVAAALQVVAFSAGGFVPASFRIYALLAAAVPGLMGVGSMYLLWPRLALGYTLLILALVVMTAWGTLFGPEHAAVLARVAYASRQVTLVLPSSLTLLGFALLGSIGAAALVLGALWSWWRTRLVFNLGIAAGGIVFSLADTLAAYGIPALFFAAEIAGVLLIYWAVVHSHAPQRAEVPAHAGVRS